MSGLLWALLAHYPVQLVFAPQAPVIPIFFHWVLAAFVILAGLWHRRRLATR